MDYLTCPGYNPPKASIRIIASSSSRLCGCCAPERRGIAVILSRCRDPLTLHPLLGFLPQPPCHLAARTHASTFPSTRATPSSSCSPIATRVSARLSFPSPARVVSCLTCYGILRNSGARELLLLGMFVFRRFLSVERVV